MKQKIEISHRTIIFTVLFLLLLWFLYQVREIILGLFIALILVGALNPTVNKLEQKGLPRWLAILLIYLGLLGLLIGSLVGIVPSLVNQTSQLAQTIGEWINRSSLFGVPLTSIGGGFEKYLAALPEQILRLSLAILSNLVFFLGILVAAFYLLMEHRELDRYLLILFGNQHEVAKRIINALEERLGRWIRAQALLMAIVGGLSYLGFRLLSLDYALPLAIIAGLLEVIPNIGPILAAIPALIAGFAISPFVGMLTVLWCFLVQQVENNFIVPKVMEKTTGVHPLVTLIVLAIGFRLAGVVGAILALPTYLTVETLVQELEWRLIKEKGPRSE